MSKDQNQPAQPVSGVMTDAEFLSKRLARVAKLAGVPMPDFSHEGIAEVAGTILGQIASKLEFDRAQDAAAIRNAALEEVAVHAKNHYNPITAAFVIQDIHAMQSAVAVNQPQQEKQGWYCANCGKGVPPEEVTYSEHHTLCGGPVGGWPKQSGKAQEPVAYWYETAFGWEFCNTRRGRPNAKNVIPLYAAAPQVAPAVPEVMTLRKALEDLIEDIHFGPLDLQREALERARLALAAAPAAPSVAAQQVAQEEGAREKSYGRAEVQKWRDDIAHAAADMVQKALQHADGDWSWLSDSIRALASAPQSDAQQSIEKDAAVREAVAYHGSKWPEELYSGVMFFKGARITKAEFEGIAKEQGR